MLVLSAKLFSRLSWILLQTNEINVVIQTVIDFVQITKVQRNELNNIFKCLASAPPIYRTTPGIVVVMDTNVLKNSAMNATWPWSVMSTELW